MQRRSRFTKPAPKGPPKNVYSRSWERQNRENNPDNCEIKQACGICPHVNESYQLGLDQKFSNSIEMLQEGNLLSKAQVLRPVKAPKELFYRCHFKLAVRPFKTVVKELQKYPQGDEEPTIALGLFRPTTHQLIPMDQCPLHTHPLRKLIGDLQRILQTSELTPYDEESQSGDLRYVTARSSHLTDELSVVFVVTKPHKVALRKILDHLKKQHRISCAFMNINDQPGNAVYGEQTEALTANQILRERLCDLDFQVGATSFFQINPWVAELAYRRIEHLVGPASSANSCAWDLYCGHGQISLILARLGFRVLGIEEMPEAVAIANKNAARNHLEEKVSFLTTKVEDRINDLPEWSMSPEVIITNPSRRGIAEEARIFLSWHMSRNPGTKLIYMSCEAETLKRDLKHFSESGLVLRQLEAFDMFPQTNGLEWLAVITK